MEQGSNGRLVHRTPGFEGFWNGKHGEPWTRPTEGARHTTVPVILRPGEDDEARHSVHEWTGKPSLGEGVAQ